MANTTALREATKILSDLSAEQPSVRAAHIAGRISTEAMLEWNRRFFAASERCAELRAEVLAAQRSN